MTVAWYRPGSTRKNWVQRRRAPRKEILLSGTLREIDSSVALCTCQILDISDGGARLKVGDPGDIPDGFLLVLYGKSYRHCEVRWRSASEVGVQFKPVRG